MNWRTSYPYRKWRATIIRRDKRCVICYSIQQRHAHHLNSAQHHPQQRFDENNGVCLCQPCHTTYHTKFKRSTRYKTTKADFQRFQKLIKYGQLAMCKRLTNQD